MVYFLSLNDIYFLLFWVFFLDGYSLLAILIGIILLNRQEVLPKKKKDKKKKKKKVCLYNKMNVACGLSV